MRGEPLDCPFGLGVVVERRDPAACRVKLRRPGHRRVRPVLGRRTVGRWVIGDGGGLLGHGVISDPDGPVAAVRPPVPAAAWTTERTRRRRPASHCVRAGVTAFGRVPLALGRGERDTPGLARFADRDAQGEHPVGEVRGEAVGVEVVAEEQLPGELAVGPLVSDHLVPFLALRHTPGPDGDHVVLDGDVDVVGIHPGQIQVHGELVAAAQGLHRHRAGGLSDGSFGESIELAERVETHECHGTPNGCAGAKTGAGPTSVSGHHGGKGGSGPIRSRRGNLGAGPRPGRSTGCASRRQHRAAMALGPAR